MTTRSNGHLLWRMKYGAWKIFIIALILTLPPLSLLSPLSPPHSCHQTHTSVKSRRILDFYIPPAVFSSLRLYVFCGRFKTQIFSFGASSFFCLKFYELVKERKESEEIVAKALDGQRYPLPLCEYMWVCDGERGSGPEGADDLCLVSYEVLGLNLSINKGIWASRLWFEPRGCD